MLRKNLRGINSINELYSDLLDSHNLIAINGTIQNLKLNNLTSSNLYALNISSSNINASIGNISNLLSTSISATNLNVSNISANNIHAGLGSFSNLQVSNITNINLRAINITASNINVSTGNITNLLSSNISSTNINVSNLSTNTINVSTGNISNLVSTNITSTNLKTSNISTNTINVSTGNISNLISTNISTTNLNTSNISTNSINASTGNISNLVSTNITNTNLRTSNISTNTINVSIGNFSNLVSTNATISGLNMINPLFFTNSNLGVRVDGSSIKISPDDGFLRIGSSFAFNKGLGGVQIKNATEVLDEILGIPGLASLLGVASIDDIADYFDIGINISDVSFFYIFKNDDHFEFQKTRKVLGVDVLQQPPWKLQLKLPQSDESYCFFYNPTDNKFDSDPAEFYYNKTNNRLHATSIEGDYLNITSNTLSNLVNTHTYKLKSGFIDSIITCGNANFVQDVSISNLVLSGASTISSLFVSNMTCGDLIQTGKSTFNSMDVQALQIGSIIGDSGSTITVNRGSISSLTASNIAVSSLSGNSSSTLNIGNISCVNIVQTGKSTFNSMDIQALQIGSIIGDTGSTITVNRGSISSLTASNIAVSSLSGNSSSTLNIGNISCVNIVQTGKSTFNSMDVQALQIGSIIGDSTSSIVVNRGSISNLTITNIFHTGLGTLDSIKAQHLKADGITSTALIATNATISNLKLIDIPNDWVDGSKITVSANKITGNYQGGDKINISGNSIAVDSSFVSTVTNQGSRLSTAESNITGLQGRMGAAEATIAGHTTAIGWLGLGVGFSIVTGLGGSIIVGAIAGSLSESVGKLWGILNHYLLYDYTGSNPYPGSFQADGTVNFTNTGSIIYTSNNSGIIQDFNTGSSLQVENDTHPLRISGGVEIGVVQTGPYTTDSSISLSTIPAHLYVSSGIRQGSISSNNVVENFFSGKLEVNDAFYANSGISTSSLSCNTMTTTNLIFSSFTNSAISTSIANINSSISGLNFSSGSTNNLLITNSTISNLRGTASTITNIRNSNTTITGGLILGGGSENPVFTINGDTLIAPQASMSVRNCNSNFTSGSVSISNLIISNFTNSALSTSIANINASISGLGTIGSGGTFSTLSLTSLTTTSLRTSNGTSGGLCMTGDLNINYGAQIAFFRATDASNLSSYIKSTDKSAPNYEGIIIGEARGGTKTEMEITGDTFSFNHLTTGATTNNLRITSTGISSSNISLTRITSSSIFVNQNNTLGGVILSNNSSFSRSNFDSQGANTPQLFNIFGGDVSTRSFWGIENVIGMGGLGDNGSASQARIPSSSSFTVNKYVSSTSISNLFTIRHSGNVGIGTTAPSALLHVSGGSIINTLTCGNLAVDLISCGSMNISAMSSNYYMANTNSSSPFDSATGITYDADDLVALLVGGILIRTNHAGINDTLPSGTDIASALGVVGAGATISFIIYNAGTGTINLNMGTGGSAIYRHGLTTADIFAGRHRSVTIHLTSSTTYNCYF